MSNIKDYREKELRWYITANILILLLLQGVFNIDSVNKENMEFVELALNLLSSAALSTVFFCFILVTDSIFSSKAKDALLYFGLFHLPAEEIFSHIKTNFHDKRFTKEQALKKYQEIYKDIPTNKKEKYRYENAKWYEIYNKHRSVTMVEVSNRDYLLCRDIYISTFFMILLYFLLSSLLKIISLDIRYLIYLFCMLVITNVGAKQKGKRFVYNVVALDIHEK